MNKRMFSIFFAICILLSLTVTVSASSEFIVENNKLISYIGQAQNVVIPAEVNGEAIIFIDSLAFDNNDKIEKVTIPEGVEIIHSEAFKNCYNLKEIIVPESLMDICAYAFSGCYDLAPVELKSEWTTIDEDAYTDADRNIRPSFFATTDYTMNGGTIVSYNGTDTEIVIPETIDGVTVTAIGASAFQGNTTITSVTMSDTITKIGERAFYKCTSITKLNLPQSITSCGKSAFGYCSGLTEVSIPGSLTTTAEYMFNGCTNIKIAVVEDGVKNLNNYCFNGCSNLVELILPESLDRIGNYAIAWCQKLPYLDIPNNVQRIEDAAFYFCNVLNDVEIPDTVTYTGTHAFRECWKLSNIKLSKGDNSIKYRAFHNCAIKALDIPDTYTSIGIEAFWQCSKLEKLELPPAIKSIGNNAFYGCTKLTEVTVYDNLTDIGLNIFQTSAGKPNTTVNVYAPETSAMYEYAKINNIATKPIVAENVAIIVGERSLGTYGTINYPIDDKVVSIGMNYIPEHLADDTQVPLLDISYDITEIKNGNTFMTVMKEIPDEAMDWTYIAKPYVKLKDGTTIWGNTKAFCLDFISTTITWEE